MLLFFVAALPAAKKTLFDEANVAGAARYTQCRELFSAIYLRLSALLHPFILSSTFAINRYMVVVTLRQLKRSRQGCSRAPEPFLCICDHHPSYRPPYPKRITTALLSESHARMCIQPVCWLGTIPHVLNADTVSDGCWIPLLPRGNLGLIS